MVTVEKAMNGLASFAEMDALPHMPNGIKKLGAYMAVESVKKNPTVFTKPYESFFKMIGVLSQDGTLVDVDALSSYLRSAFEKVPSVELWGFSFNAQDAEKLLERMGEQ